MNIPFHIIPKLPAKDLDETRIFFETKLQFSTQSRYPDYLIMKKGPAELHFFRFVDLDPMTNYAMIYIRLEKGIEELYADYQQRGVAIHPNGPLETKPWGTKEFAVLDPNNTLLTFGQLT
ncbi:MAG TPA: VOC family protein [Algoriphagus sp.]|nr:VOC family protein [Algoriphagus sp.]